MKVPPIVGVCCFGVVSSTKKIKDSDEVSLSCGLNTDTISFSSRAKFLKKYNTLPDKIKQVLSPSDAVDMFENIEMISQGKQRGEIVGLGDDDSELYKNQWLDNYYILIVQNPYQDKQVVYSSKNLGDSVWQDSDDIRVQLVESA